MAINFRSVAQGVCVAAAAIGVSITAGQTQAQAFDFGGAGKTWDYAIGSQTNGSGGSVYQYQGIAVRQTNDKIFVAVNANMGMNGSDAGITYGDLMFNFSGKSLNEASAAGQLFGVRFAQTNSESGAATTGLYSNVTAKSVTHLNQGWGSMASYNSWANGGGSQDGNSYGDLRADSSYFAQDSAALNSINTGTRVGNITMLNAADLLAQGLNFSGAAGSVNAAFSQGSNTFGFSFDKTAGFSGNFIASLFAECGNDGLVISSEATPEPTTMAGMALAGAGMSFFKRRQKKQQG
jgi:hypothetical protein